MLTAAIALFSLAAQGAPATPKPSEILSKMLAHYHSFQTLTGTIKLRQSANGQLAPGSLDTTLQIEWPAKLYIKQVQNTVNWGTETVLINGKPTEVQLKAPPTWLVTSDGINFSYDSPEEAAGSKQRLVEPVKPRPNESLDIRGLYTAVSRCIGDRSAPLEVAIGRADDLRFLTRSLVTLEYAGKTKIGEDEVYIIRGDWRDPNLTEQPVGTYEIAVTEAGDFKRYIVRQTIQPDRQIQPVDVASIWEINLVVNGKPDPGLFKVVK